MFDFENILKTSFLTREEILDFQFQKIQKSIQYAASKSPFYRKHFEKNGIDIQNIHSLEDFLLIPTSCKDDLQVENTNFWCFGRDNIIDYVTTSGTLGNPVTVVLGENDLQRLAVNEAASYITAGCSSSDIFQLTTTIDKRFMAGLAYFEGARYLKSGIVRVGPGAPALQWETILRIRPTVLIAVPSFLLKMIEFAHQNGIDPSKSSVKKVICIGESIRNINHTLNTLGNQITEKWDIELFSTYASTEMATAFTECIHHNGLHENPALVYTEILDENQQPVAPGEPGELTFTNFDVEAMPFIRFRSGDIVRAFTETCSCGRNSLRIGPVEGRLNQMIKLKGTTLFPPSILDVLNQVKSIEDYRIEIYKTALDTDAVTVFFASPHSDFNSINNELAAIFQSKLRVIPEIVWENPEILKQKKYPEGARKPLTIIDRR
jgi:phenylacetate-CoA ligase